MNITDIDLQILKIFNHPSSMNVDVIIVAAIFAVYAFMIYLVYYYFKNNYTKKFAHLAVTAIVGYIIVTIIKDLVARPRPYANSNNGVTAVITKPYDPYSFPSGHSFIAFLLFNFLPPSWPKFVKYLAAAYLIFIPIGSMYIGVHYPSDVLVGSLLGLIFPKILSDGMASKIFDMISKIFGKISSLRLR